MIARLTEPDFTSRGHETAAPVPKTGKRAASKVRSGLGSLGCMIRKAREQLRVSRDEFSLLDVVVPPGEDGPMSRQELNDWICRTSKKGKDNRPG
ncbi:hypothetical protein [Roseibium sp. Sym1]|uniref:hypothetical protein n=1 Tax=Roseibium sp. Sym1 TaxID=3016006 RepID=UPI0022B4D5AC|nr:hypothetical protein [Roseibium sp. Sym1]